MDRIPNAKVLLVAAVALLVVGAGVFGYWQASGGHFVTQYQVEQTVVEEDEFGGEVERTVMQDEFRFGLLPDKPYDGAVTLGGIPAGVGAALLVLAVVKIKRDGGDGEIEEGAA